MNRDAVKDLSALYWELEDIETDIERKNNAIKHTQECLDLLNADMRELQNAKESIEKKVNELANKIRRS